MYTSGFAREAEPYPNENIAAMTQMGARTNNRKRSRTSEQDGCEFMPISKRINQLHIRSSNAANNSDVDDESEDSFLQMSSGNMGESSSATSEGNISPEMRDISSVPLMTHSGLENESQQYDPDLTEQENPYYFHINCMLFELHLQRITRHSLSHQMNHQMERPQL